MLDIPHWKQPTPGLSPLTEDELQQAETYRWLVQESPEFREFVDALGLVLAIWELEYDAIVLDCNYMTEMEHVDIHFREAYQRSVKADNPKYFRQYLPFFDNYQFELF